MGGLSLISTGWCCLGLASLSTTYCCSCRAHCIKPKDTEEEYCHSWWYFHLVCILHFVANSFHNNMWGVQKYKTPCSMSATRRLRFYKTFMWRLMNCMLQWQCSLAWSYLSLIQNYSITHMHALVAANAGVLHRPCQPRCDTEHDNVCNLLGVVCLPSALPFEVLPPVPLQPYCNSAAEPVRVHVLHPITF